MSPASLCHPPSGIEYPLAAASKKGGDTMFSLCLGHICRRECAKMNEYARSERMLEMWGAARPFDPAQGPSVRRRLATMMCHGPCACEFELFRDDSLR